MKIGSSAHKELLCRAFFDGHKKYEPKDLPWPDLDDEPLALLRSIPFWTHALQAEEDAGPMISAVAVREPDPLLREALELQAYEETRHANIIRHMINRYGLHADEVHAEVPDDVVAGFIDFGFEECLDSFGAFGLFKLARQHMLVPEPLFDIFDQVMQEEAYHIVFFINWFAHRQANLGGWDRRLRPARSLWHYAKAVRKLAGLVTDDDSPEGKDFVVTGASAFVENLTPRLVIAASLEENERRLARFDRRLIVPELLPRLARVVLACMNVIPQRGPAAHTRPAAGASARSDKTQRAA
jgi:hypothetical protein